MNRKAPETVKLSNALVERGYNVTPRRLERWSINGLGPIGFPSFEELVSHYARVMELSRVGRDVDLVARRLAARGFACERLRAAILREMSITPEPPEVLPPVIDLSSEASGDAGFATLETLAVSMAASTDGLPPFMVRLTKALYRKAAKRADELREPPEAIFHSFIVNALAHLVGDDYYNGQALEAVLDLEGGSVSPEVLDLINTRLRVSVAELDDAYRTVPPDHIALMAHRICAWVPILLDHLGITGVAQGEIEDVATVFAPLLIHYFSLMREVFADFPEELLLPRTPVPAELSA